MTSSFPGTEPAPGLVVSTHLRTAAGSPLPVEVTLTNNAAAPRILTVGALGVDAAWLPAPVRTAVLDPGQSTMVTLILSPTKGTVPAHYPFAFTVQALDPGTGRPAGAAAVMVDSTLMVNPRNQLTLELRPRSVSTVSSRKVKLALRNAGNEPARVTLDVQTSPRVRVRFRKKVVEVLPGATELVRGRATVVRRRLFGGTDHHTYTVSASGTESLRHVEGSVAQHPLVGTMLMKAVALLCVLAVWIGAAVIFIPQLAHKISDGSSETTAATADGGKDSGSKGGSSGAGGDSGADGGSGGSGDSGGDSGSGGSGGSGGTQQAADTAADEIALTGTVTGDQPGGVKVSLEPTSLVDEDAQGGVGVGVPSSELGTSGMALASAFLNRALPTTPPDRTATTSADGSWAFAGVKKPGYYLLTFTKLGFQKQSFVIDSTNDAATEPLEVELAAGEGTLSGTVTSPRGQVGAATVTITDGTNTISTSSNSRGRIGHWEVKGLSTPGAYVVQAQKPGLSSESRMVDLSAGGTATANLRLRNGVATLVGRVRSTDESGELSGVGGATVTVTGDDGIVRTATTLTRADPVAGSGARVSAAFVGTYTVPGLPAPGTYVVTLSGPGLQTQTSTVKIRPGQSRADQDADLTASSGSVTGTITGIDTDGNTAGIVGAGLTLSNADNTYKTMSTSQPRGSFLFDGVAPGTYLLQTQFFGYVSDHVTVTVRAGRSAVTNRQIAEVEGGVLAARSSVQGRAIDGSTGLAVNCPADHDDCLVATVVEPGVEDDGSGAHAYTTDFLPTDQFTLPDPIDDPDGGLLPGLHRVVVSAPHYSSASTSVQVGTDGTANLGTIALLPAPKIVGTITAAIGTPSARTCVWAVPQGGAAPPAGCEVAGTSHECQATPATFSDASIGRQCAYTAAGTGSFSIEVPAAGTYTVYVQPGDPEFLAPDPASIVLDSGVTRNQSYTLNRYGRLTLTVRKPGPSGTLVPAAGATVTLNPVAGDPQTTDGKTRSDGTTEFFRLPVGGYTATATSGDLVGVSPVTSIGLNQVVSLRITASNPIPAVIGQVTSTYNGAVVPVPGATVTVVAPADYAADDGSPITGTATMTTEGQGCFLIEKGPDSPAVPGAGDCHWAAGADASRGQQTFLSPATSLIKVEKTGYTTVNQTNTTLLTADTDVNAFALTPLPVTLGVVRPGVAPDDASFDWTQVHFDVSPLAGPTNQISVAATGTGSDGQLTWVDQRTGGSSGVVLPGTYDIAAQMAGYQDASGRLDCPVAGSCAWVDDATHDALTLTKLSALQVTAKDGTTVPDASYTLSHDGITDQTLVGTTDGVTFEGLDPAETDYKVAVRSAGYDFGSPSDSLAITCGSHSSIVLSAGTTTECDVTMRRLGTITGTVTGVPAVPPATDPVVDLAGAAVTITECTTVVSGACTATSTANSFTGTALDDGTFSITGTATKQGLDLDKDWLVTAVSTGYKLADTTGSVKPGTLVTSFTGGAATADIAMQLRPVNFSVVLLLGGTTQVTGATVQLRKLTSGGGTSLVQAGVASGTSYGFTDIVPGSYIVSFSGAGLRAETSSVLVTSNGQVVTLPVSRAVNVAYGTIAASDGGVIAGATVTVCSTAACSGANDGAANGADGVPMTQDTDGTGSFAIRAVPDGDYWVRVTKDGYRPQTLGSFHFDQTLGALPPVSPTLVLVTRQVTVTVTTPWANNDLATDGVRASLTRVGGGATAYTDVALTAVSANTFAASFNQVKWGCWTVALTIPAPHHGSPGALTGGPADPKIACTGTDALTVPMTDTTTPATASLALDEGRLDVTAALVNYPGFAITDPGDVHVTVTRDGHTWYDEDDFTLGSAATELWLPTGGDPYTVTAELVNSNAFWSGDSADVTVPAAQPTPDESVVAALTLEEKAAELKVQVNGAGSGGATLTLDPPAGVTVPAAYLPSVTTGADGKYVFAALPEGEWTVTATITGDTDEGTITLAAPQSYTLPALSVVIAATGATAGTPGTYTPTGAVAPANFAALTGVVASPATAWTTGQRIVLGNTTLASWNGTAWVVGAVP